MSLPETETQQLQDNPDKLSDATRHILITEARQNNLQKPPKNYQLFKNPILNNFSGLGHQNSPLHK